MVAPVARTAPRAAPSCHTRPAGQAPLSLPTAQGAAVAVAGGTPVGEVEATPVAEGTPVEVAAALPVAAVAGTPAVEVAVVVAPAPVVVGEVVAVEVVAGTTNPQAHCIA